MTDLYDEAAALPRLLSGSQTPSRYCRLRGTGARPRSTGWAARRTRLTGPPRGVALPGGPPADLLDTLRATLLALPASAVLAHHSAAMLYGFGVGPAQGVHVAVPAGSAIPQRRGVRAHESVLPFDQVTDVLGLPCLSAARCAIDLARTLPRPDGLAVLDAALRVGACTTETLTEEIGRHDRLRGVRRARELVPLADPRAECRQETRLRLLLHDSYLPPPKPQLPVVDDCGVERHRIDLGYEEHRLGLEYDGSTPPSQDRLPHDRARHNWLATNGWRLHYISDVDLYRRPGRLVRSVRHLLAGCRSRP